MEKCSEFFHSHSRPGVAIAISAATLAEARLFQFETFLVQAYSEQKQIASEPELMDLEALYAGQLDVEYWIRFGKARHSTSGYSKVN